MDSEWLREQHMLLKKWRERERADERLLREFNQGKVILIKLVLFKLCVCVFVHLCTFVCVCVCAVWTAKPILNLCETFVFMLCFCAAVLTSVLLYENFMAYLKPSISYMNESSNLWLRILIEMSCLWSIEHCFIFAITFIHLADKKRNYKEQKSEVVFLVRVI